jgi:hypothetical protein
MSLRLGIGFFSFHVNEHLFFAFPATARHLVHFFGFIDAFAETGAKLGGKIKGKKTACQTRNCTQKK